MLQAILPFLTAIALSAIAAFYSVIGLAQIFPGSFWPIILMGSVLEVAKLVTVSWLYNNWIETNRLIKTYFIVAIILLMAITSMGIFGFLTSAYQSSLVEYSQAETQQTFMVSQKAILEKELESLTMRVETLNQSRLSQEKRLPEMSRAAAKPVYEDIAKSGEEISQTRTRMNQVFEEIKTLDLQTLEAQKQSGKQKDIGTLKYAAELFNTDINTIVKWFTLAIIVVFDPLAIALVLGYNIAANRTFEEEEVTEETKKKVNIITKTFFDKAKYRN
jgi:hypothetical protein